MLVQVQIYRFKIILDISLEEEGDQQEWEKVEKVMGFRDGYDRMHYVPV